MYKAKLTSFAIAGILGLVSINPITVFAAETNTESVTLSETDKNHKEKKAAFEEKIKKAKDKWNTLSAKQKDEVYALLENEIVVEIDLMNKLVELGVMEKDDAEKFKTRMTNKLTKAKESGEFPFSREKGHNCSK